jgi:RNA polymerase sigma-70 factor (sigma-E family)
VAAVGSVLVGMRKRHPSTADAEFASFVGSNYPRLLHLADLLIGDRGVAEDLLQSVLTRTYLRWSAVRQGNPLGYVRAGLVNARADWLRRGRHRETPSPSPPDPRTGPDHATEIAGRDAIQRALSGLTPRERSVVVLRYFEDLTESEIARTLGVAPGTVKSACARALTKLRVSPQLALTDRKALP